MLIFSTLEYTADQIHAWDNFITNSPFAHLFQTFEWGEISKESGWTPERYWVRDNGQIKAVAQILTRNKYGFQIQYIPRGPIFKDADSFSFLMQNLRRISKRTKTIVCRINPAIVETPEIIRNFTANTLIKSKTRDMHVCTFRVDVTQSLDDLWARLEGSVRGRIRKAEKSGVIIDSNSEESLNSFYRIYSQLSQSGKTTTHSFQFIKKVWDILSGKGVVKIFTAFHAGTPIATEFVFLNGKIGELMWIANAKLKNDVGGSQLVHWHIIKWLKENGYTDYDLGGVPPDPNELPGVYFHKKNIGGNLIKLVGEFEFSERPLLFYLWRHLSPLYLSRHKIQLKLKSRFAR